VCVYLALYFGLTNAEVLNQGIKKQYHEEGVSLKEEDGDFVWGIWREMLLLFGFVMTCEKWLFGKCMKITHARVEHKKQHKCSAHIAATRALFCYYNLANFMITILFRISSLLDLLLCYSDATSI